jgi:hypothetical protein
MSWRYWQRDRQAADTAITIAPSSLAGDEAGETKAFGRADSPPQRRLLIPGRLGCGGIGCRRWRSGGRVERLRGMPVRVIIGA